MMLDRGPDSVWLGLTIDQRRIVVVSIVAGAVIGFVFAYLRDGKYHDSVLTWLSYEPDTAIFLAFAGAVVFGAAALIWVFASRASR
jgi:hypothetical protein